MNPADIFLAAIGCAVTAVVLMLLLLWARDRIGAWWWGE